MQEVDDIGEEIASEAALPPREAQQPPEEAASPPRGAHQPPSPPELKRSCKMREKVPCPDCGKQVSYHTLTYGSHKKTCKGRSASGAAQSAKNLAAPPPETPAARREASPLPEAPAEAGGAGAAHSPPAPPKKRQPAQSKPPLSQKQAEKPLKSKQVIQRTPAPEPFENVFAAPLSWYEQMVHMRNQQAMARNEAMLAPYQALFASRGARNNLHHQR